ncbi:MAG: glycosyltransferase family 39 protein [Oscillospiraceae bacterium]|nr:glycosyltransferase family 39 protein [Oscillospiraceae bacterium]
MICFLSSVNLAEKASAFTMILCFVLPLFCLIFVCFFFARNGSRSRLFGFFLWAASFLLKSGFALAIHTRPESDFHLLYSAAQNLAGGGGNLGALPYFQYWPYQSAFAAWMAFFIRWFGADVVFFKLMNCLFSASSTLLVYLLAKRFASERGARAAAVLFLIYPGTFLLIPVLTNQHLSEFLVLLAVYLFTAPAKQRKGRLAKSAAASAFLALSNAIRPMGILMIAAVAGLTVMQIISPRKDRKAKREAFASAFLFAALFFLITFSLSGLAKAAGLNEYGLGNSVPQWKFILGFNAQSIGQYSAQDAKTVFGGGFHPDAADRLLRQRLSIRPLAFLNLAFQKAKIMWGSFEPTFWAFTGNVCAEIGTPGSVFSLTRVLRNVCKFTAGLYIWSNLLIALGAISPFREKRENRTHELLMLAALAYFFALSVIEIQTRYRSLMTALTFPLAAAGLDLLWGTWQSFRRHGRREAVLTERETACRPIPFA